MKAHVLGAPGKGEQREARLWLSRRQSLIRPSYIMATSRDGSLFGLWLPVPYIHSHTLSMTGS